MSQGKILDGDSSFIGGMNSSIDPAQLSAGFFARGMNIVNRGGIAQCRPGYQCRFAMPDGTCQGLSVFAPKLGAKVLVIAVGGLIYTSEYPFRSFTQISGIQFSPLAKQVFFKQVEQSIEINPDNSLAFINPRNLLVIQDGGFSAPAVYNGTTAEHQRGDGYIPLGGPMEWVGDRLWVARGSQLYASDIGNPTRFTETQYIAGVEFFVFPAEITALAKNPADASAQLFVFTTDSTHRIQAGVRDRTLWVATANFQSVLFPNVGCVSQQSVVAHYGYLYWMSKFGLTNIDTAAQAFVSSSLPYIDEPMQDSKSRLSDDLSGVAGVAFENYLLMSVPYADDKNRHTWCLDNSVLETGQRETPTWNSYWTGTRPSSWVTDSFNNQNRCFYLSPDYDGTNRVWEAFIADRLDDGCPITWFVESRGYNGQTPGMEKHFRYARIFLSELLGDVDVAVFWAGAHRGKYKRVLTKRIKATNGTLRFDTDLTADQNIFALKKQSREIRTQDGKEIIADETLSSCDVEYPGLDFVDESFQLIIVGSGPGAVRGLITYMEPPKNTDDAGRCEEDEIEENFVRFDGAASESSTLEKALEDFDSSDSDGEHDTLFTSNRTETLTQDGVTEVGVGEAESIISQADADKIAECIARRRAAVMLEAALPQILSIGEVANQ